MSTFNLSTSQVGSVQGDTQLSGEARSKPDKVPAEKNRLPSFDTAQDDRRGCHAEHRGSVIRVIDYLPGVSPIDWTQGAIQLQSWVEGTVGTPVLLAGTREFASWFPSSTWEPGKIVTRLSRFGAAVPPLSERVRASASNVLDGIVKVGC